MAQVTVSEEALRELVREALDGGHLGDLTMPEEEEPVNVNDVVDPSAAVTDPVNPCFVPQTKPELDVALKQLTKDVPVDDVPKFYKAVRAVHDAELAQTEENAEMKKAAQGGTEQVEEAVRRAVRRMIRQMNEAPADLPPVKKIPPGVHGAEYMRRLEKTKADLGKAFRGGGADDRPEPDEDEAAVDEPKKRRAYKSTALGSMADVEGASFEQIAKELEFSVAGAKQAVDKALEKARWAATEIDPDDLEILVLTTMNDYINMLAKTGELSAADVQLMKDHPDIVRELDGFREYLSKTIRRKRKEGQKLYDPMGEHRRRLREALGAVGMQLADAGPPDPYADDPAYQKYLSKGPPCDHCGSENIEVNEPIPSMAGYGEDESWTCKNCGKTSFSGPEMGPSCRARFGEGKRPKVNEARHGKRIMAGNVPLRLNTKDPEWNALETESGYQVARQAKRTSGRVFQQGMNPDYKGRESYMLQYKDPNDESWRTYDSQSRKGDLLNPTFLRRIASSYAPRE
jgi:hypothetical protein